MIEALRTTGAGVEEVAFTAQTPRGPVAMKNVIAKFDGAGDRVVIISGHYDTLSRPDLHFVGANDQGPPAKGGARDGARFAPWRAGLDRCSSIVGGASSAA